MVGDQIASANIPHIKQLQLLTHSYIGVAIAASIDSEAYTDRDRTLNFLRKGAKINGAHYRPMRRAASGAGPYRRFAQRKTRTRSLLPCSAWSGQQSLSAARGRKAVETVDRARSEMGMIRRKAPSQAGRIFEEVIPS